MISFLYFIPVNNFKSQSNLTVIHPERKIDAAPIPILQKRISIGRLKTASNFKLNPSKLRTVKKASKMKLIRSPEFDALFCNSQPFMLFYYYSCRNG